MFELECLELALLERVRAVLAAGEPVALTETGAPIGVIVSPAVFEEWQRLLAEDGCE